MTSTALHKKGRARGPRRRQASPSAARAKAPRPPLEQRIPRRATLRRQRISCGKEGCGGCPHGPYWYAYWKEGGRTRSQYIGKDAAMGRLLTARGDLQVEREDLVDQELDESPRRPGSIPGIMPMVRARRAELAREAAKPRSGRGGASPARLITWTNVKNGGANGRTARGHYFKIRREKLSRIWRGSGFGAYGWSWECVRGRYAGSGPFKSPDEAKARAEQHARELARR